MNEIRRITIVGLGQIGGSIVLAVRKRKLPYHLTGIDKSRKLLRLLAPQLDKGLSAAEKISGSDLIILCLHYRDIISYLETARQTQLMMDVCSAKEKVVQYASSRALRFIGGHPMAGNERLAEAGWDPDLFEGRPFFLCPSASANRSDFGAVKKFVEALGAKSKRIDPAEHDRHLASTSHFAAFLSTLYSKITKDSPEIFRGPGYQSMTRLASTSPELLQTFLDANGENILARAERFQIALSEWILRTREARQVQAKHKGGQPAAR